MGAGDGNGWVACRCGHRHWGRFGAAGLLLLRRGHPAGRPDGAAGRTVDGTPTTEVLLQLRAEWTHQGGTWGLPGGAADSHEGPVAAALREAWEETDVGADHVDVLSTWVSTDHVDWAYTVVVAAARPEASPRAANAESVDVRWVPLADVARMRLHPGLAEGWASLSGLVSRLVAG